MAKLNHDLGGRDNGVRLDGKQALIIGASSGIGYAVAKAYAEYGAEVTILADDLGITQAAESISALTGNPVTALQCDITNRERLHQVLAPLERIDILVHNAGFERLTPLQDEDPAIEDTFRKIIDVNLLGAYHVTRELIARIPDGGRIIYTASTYSKYAIARMSAYASSKHALLGMMRSFADELGPRRITVNAVCPGWVNTEFANRSVRKIANDSGRTIEAVSNDVFSMQAIEGHLEPDDMIGGYLFFASGLARDITGQSLHIDRGEYQN